MSSDSGSQGPTTDVEAYDLVVLGASFAGVEVLYQLWRRFDGKIKTAVVDRQRAHGYIPLVTERLCGGLEPGSSALQTSAYVESLPHTRFIEDEVTGFDPETKQVTLASGRTLSGRMIVVALGSVLRPPPTIGGHERMVVHKLQAEFEDAQVRLLETLKGEGETPGIVVVGGGITGVELAGELAHLAKKRPEGWRAPKVTLVTRGARLVENLPASVARAVHKTLEGQGVDVRLNTGLNEVTDVSVLVEGSGGAPSEIPCALAFWAGGVGPAPVLDALGLPQTEAGWLSVGPSLQCFCTPEPTHPEIFACGDAVRIQGGDGEWPTMQRAIECLWQAKVVAKNLIRIVKQKPDDPDGPPPMLPHRLRASFPYGLSLGAKSLLVVGAARVHIPGVTAPFRRFLMRQYFDRYTPVASS